MTRLEEIQAREAEILALLKVVDEQVEALYDVVKNGDVPEPAAAAIQAGLDAIAAAAEKVKSDDEPSTP